MSDSAFFALSPSLFLSLSLPLSQQTAKVASEGSGGGNIGGLQPTSSAVKRTVNGL